MLFWDVDGIPLTLLKNFALTAVVLVCWVNAWRGAEGRPRQVAIDAMRHGGQLFALALLPLLVPGLGFALLALLFPVLSNALFAVAAGGGLLLVSVAVEAVRARRRARGSGQGAPRGPRTG